MRIAHIVCTFPPLIGGMGAVAFQMAGEQAARGHDVEVFTPQYGEPEEELVTYVERLRPAFHYGLAAYMPQISKRLKEFDVIHLHYPFYGTANLIRRFKKKHPEKALIVTYHMDNRAPGWLGGFFRLYATWWMPRILNAADAIIGSTFDYISTSDAAKHFQDHPEKWHELPFGVDTERFSPREKPAAVLYENGLRPDLPVILFVGGMDPQHHFKGVSVLLQALYLLKKDNIPCQGLLVGDGLNREKYALQAQGLGLRELVAFSGSVSYEDLPYYYNAADLFVLPSIHRGEAFGLVLLEAMASGIPVIGTDLPGVRTVAQVGGWTIPPKDPLALAQMIQSYLLSTEKEELGYDARRRAVEHFSWGNIIERLEAIYENAIAKARENTV